MKIPFNSFVTGEIDESLSARYDLAKYKPACRVMKNFLVELHGNARRRPGTRFLEDLGADAVLVPFQFSNDPAQCLQLVFTAGKIRFATPLGFIESGGTPVEVTTEYTLDELNSISYAQSGDVVYLAHQNHPLRRLSRLSSTSWALADVTLEPAIDPPAGVTGTFTPGPTASGQVVAPTDFTLRYRVAAATDKGQVSYGSAPIEVLNARHPSDWIQGDHVDLTIPAVEGASEFLVYREEGGYYGFVGIVKDRTNNVLDIKVFTTHRQATAIGSNTVCRLYFDDTSWASVDQQIYVTDPTKYRGTHKITAKGTGTMPIKPYVEFTIRNIRFTEIAKPSVYGVKYASAATFGFYFTDSKYVAETSKTPKDEYNPFRGGNNPGLVGFHEQRLVLGGAVQNPQTLYGSKTGDFDGFYKSTPLRDDDPYEFTLASGSIDAISWIVSFGEMLVGTGGAEYKVSGGNDPITPSNVKVRAQSYWGSDRIAPLVIGNSVLHVQRQGGNVRDLFYSLEKDGYAGNDLTVLAPHLFRGHTIRRWAHQQIPDSVVWAVRDDGVLLGLTYLKEHDIWAWHRHVTDGEVRSVSTIMGVKEDTVFLVVKRTVDGQTKYYLELLEKRWMAQDGISAAFFVDCGLTYSGSPATTISGLEHLEGKTVSILADGSPVEGVVVTSGSVTIPYPASVVHVGLPYESVLAPMPPEIDTKSGTTLGRVRTVGLSKIRVLDTVGGKYGSSEDRLYDFSFLPETWGGAVQPYTGDLDFSPDPEQTSQTTVYIVQDRPLPMTVIALILDVSYEG